MGGLHGTVSSTEGHSSAGAKVAVCSVSGFDCTTVLADADGRFAVAELPEGHYQVAMVNGNELMGTVVREVAAGEDVAADVVADPQTATPAAGSGTAAKLDQSFMHKLGRSYVADWAGNGPGTAVPQKERRGTPAPIY